MTILSHTLGFPRIGLYRELKIAQENYWSGNISQLDLINVGKNLRIKHWEKQKNLGIDILPVGDFAFYDHVLNTSMMLNNIPERHIDKFSKNNIDTMFRIGRGSAPTGHKTSASAMLKWFNTNYHYIVPEFIKNQEFSLNWMQLFKEIDEALSLGYKIKPVLLGPISYLWLGKVIGKSFDKLSLLPSLIIVYKQILNEIYKKKIQWVQIDEPILVLELPEKWNNSYYLTYDKLQGYSKILLTTYFDSISHQINMIKNLPIDGLHVDITTGNNNLESIHYNLPSKITLSIGAINGRNIWKADLNDLFDKIFPLIKKRNILLGTSCSLLHSPIDLNIESELDEETKNWLSFSVQKCNELKILSNALNNPNKENKKIIKIYSVPIKSRIYSTKVHNNNVKNRLDKINKININRKDSYNIRYKLHKKYFKLPKWPTTTIGSFPQTDEIRKLRRDFKSKKIDFKNYNNSIKEHIKNNIFEQESLGLDVLVHGESERNDMVEYFSEYLHGFILTQNGWVQSYGSRCVKPPIIYGDISRPKSITTQWIKYAQSLTNKPVKGMLTGPITILCWSFVREDITREIISKQIALALRDEVLELESSGIRIIQIDEPALREGLPLKQSQWVKYLEWAVNSFKLSSSVVKNTTQIHTHMCYCEFHDIIDAISKLDVDVITIETSRSEMKLLEVFKQHQYKNSIGPGVYDIHSPNIPSEKYILMLLKKASKYISTDKLWINPDCGLKTRNWKEIRCAIYNMVEAAKKIRCM
ncbi:MAG: 5-methyltetrahydropteroyltriglutamate--homocysteine S-methyltransferase [Enterobacterales bacterium]